MSAGGLGLSRSMLGRHLAVNPLPGGLAEQQVFYDVDLAHDQGGETALVEEDLGGLWVAPVDGRWVSVP